MKANAEVLADTGKKARVGEKHSSFFQKGISILFIMILNFYLGQISGVEVYGQAKGFKFYKNYKYQEYDHHPQNWEMVQGENGVLYFANNGGLLIYDGAVWRVVYFPDFIGHSLALDQKGVLFVGGKNEFFRLSADRQGVAELINLANQLPENLRSFGTVWNTHATHDGIYFRTKNFLFFWDYSRLHTCRLSQSLAHAFQPNTPLVLKASAVCRNVLIVQEEKIGLLRVEKNMLFPIPGGDVFQGEKIWMLVPYGDVKSSGLLIGMRGKGFYIFEGGQAKQFLLSPSISEFLKSNNLINGIHLSSGDYALATRGGLIIIGRDGTQKANFDKTTGLQDDNLNSVFQDRQGNLWLCLNNGITKIEYSFPVTMYNENSGLPSLILSVVKHKHELYVGAKNGLFKINNLNKFTQISGISGCFDLISTDNSVLAAAENGIFQVFNNSEAVCVLNSSTNALLRSRYMPDSVWCGTRKGVTVLMLKNGRWGFTHDLEMAGQEITGITEDEKNNLWLTGADSTVYRIKLADNFRDNKITTLNDLKNFAIKEIFIAYAAQHVIFATSKGIFRYDEKKNALVPDLTLGNDFAGSEKGKPVFRISGDSEGRIWFTSESRIIEAIQETGGLYRLNFTPFRRLLSSQVNDIYVDPDERHVWFGNNDGILCYDKIALKAYNTDFNTLIRKIVANKNHGNERLVYNGDGDLSDKSSEIDQLHLDYIERNIHIEFTAPFFEAEEMTQYRYLLEGFDEDWSLWVNNTSKSYTNLPSGDYKFRVQARNVYLHHGREKVFHLSILPPWFLTWWAFVVYGMIIIVLMLGYNRILCMIKIPSEEVVTYA